MRLTRVEIDGFQCHSGVELDMAPGLNAVMGPTDSGKSAVVRAIAWALYNEPAGMAFLGRRSKTCTVALTFDNGLRIERIRSKRVNRYKIQAPGEDEVVLDDFGRGLCFEVAALTGIRPVDIVGKDVWLNVQQQHDPPLLLARPWSGIDRANLLDLIAENDRLAVLVGDFNRDVQNIGRELKASEKKALELDAELEQLGDLDAKLAEVERMEQALAGMRKLRKSTSDLRAGADRIEINDGEADRFQETIDGLPAIPDPDRLARATSLASTAQELRGCSVSVERVDGDISAAQREIERHGATSASVDPATVQRVERARQLRAIADELDVLRGRIEKGGQHVRELEGDDQTAREELAILVEEQGACPICGGELDQEHILTEATR